MVVSDVPADGRTACVLTLLRAGAERDEIVAALRGSGYRVLEVADAGDVAPSMRTSPVDVVLFGLEAAGGQAALDKLRRDAIVERAAVVVVTASCEVDEVTEGLRRGVHDYLRSPVVPGDLLARVDAAIRSKRAQDHVLELTRVDELTGLPNRRHTSEHLTMACSSARRHNRPLTLLVVDLDRFRRVNDAEGHLVGDAVLRTVARRIASVLRTEDTAGRWGGEEFLVIAPGTDLDGGWRLGERIRSAVADRPVQARGRSVVVTVSIGCAEGRGDDVDDQLARADQALCSAKEQGRNRVVADTTVAR